MSACQPKERPTRTFAADLSTGATHQIVGWSLNIETVPEPSMPLLLTLGSVLLCSLRRRSA